MINLVKRISGSLFRQIVTAMQSGKIELEGGSIDLSSDQTIRIHDGKITFTPPARVSKRIEILSGRLGAINAGTSIREIDYRADNDLIHVDLLSSPIDVDVKPEASQMRSFLSAPDPESEIQFVLAPVSSWEDIKEECYTRFRCSDAIVSGAVGSQQKQLKHRRREAERVVTAVEQVMAQGPVDSSEELTMKILPILFPLLPKFLAMLVISVFQRLIVDWLFRRMSTGDGSAGVPFDDIAGLSKE